MKNSTTINLKDYTLKSSNEVVQDFNNDVNLLKTEVKRIQSIKCRFKKQKARKDYDEVMSQILAAEQVLKEAKQLLEPTREKPTYEYTEEDVKLLDYDETVKAIKSVQSKKCLCQWDVEDINKNEVYQQCLKVEELLKAQKDSLSPTDKNHVKKSQVLEVITMIENQPDVDIALVLENLVKLVEEA